MSLSKYRITKHLSANVLLAEHTNLGRDVQLHRFPTDELRGDARRLLIDVATKFATIDHPHIPHLLDFIQAEDAYVLILESHPGQRLTDVLAGESNINAMHAAARAEKIGAALRHAHQRGLAHGALTTDHIVEDTLGLPKVLGIGMQQASAGRPLDLPQLVDQDLRSLGTILLASLSSPAPEHAEDANDDTCIPDPSITAGGATVAESP